MKISTLFLFVYKFFQEYTQYRSRVRTWYVEKLRKFGQFFYVIFGSMSLFILTLEFGFYYPESWRPILETSIQLVILYFIAYEILHLIFTEKNYLLYIKIHRIEIVILFLLVLEFFLRESISQILATYRISGNEATLYFLSFNQVLFLFSHFAHFIRQRTIYTSKKLNHSIVFVGSFAVIILLGFVFLQFPKSMNGNLRSIDIFFTTVSATCVTGLSTLDISSSFTISGQLILLLLIQVGGLGLMTLTSYFSIVLAGQIRVSDQLLVKDLFSEDSISRAKSILRNITLQTIFLESVGACFLFFSLPEGFSDDMAYKIYFSIFHAISAFCNAGFSLLPTGMDTEGFRNSWSFLGTLMMLIMLGGIGFPVLVQIRSALFFKKGKPFRWSIATLLAIYTTSFLLLVGTISFFSIESNGSLQNQSISEKVLSSIFFSVTTRTAGFNNLDMSLLSTPILFLSFFLMWVGASPISTGGGIKTTTFALSFLNILNEIRGKEKMEWKGRTIAQASIARASATVVLSLFVIFTAIFTLLFTEKAEFLQICFEVVSAFGTVGLSLNLTPHLTDYGKVIICIVMFVGRVGILSLLIAFTRKTKNLSYQYPNEYVVVG